MTETELQRQVILTAHQLGWRVAHFRSVQLKNGRWQTPVQADGAGFPDLILTRGQQLLAVELKAERGVVSPEQTLWLEAFAATGAFVDVWRPAAWDSQEIPRLLMSTAIGVR